MDTLDAHQLRAMIGKARPRPPQFPPETVGGPDEQEDNPLSQKIGDLSKGARKRSLDQLLGTAHHLPQSPQKQKGKPQTKNIGTDAGDLVQDPIILDATIRKHLGLLVKMLLQANKQQHLATILQEHQLFIQEVLELLENKANKKGNSKEKSL